MPSLLLLIMLNLFAVDSTGQPGPLKIDYILQPVYEDSQFRLKITGTFQSGHVRSTRLEIPFGYGAQKSFQKCISSLQILSNGCRLRDTDSSFIKVVDHLPGQVIRFEYLFGNAASLLPGEEEETNVLPQFTQHSFWFSGLSSWIVPVVPDQPDYPVSIRLHWKGFPPGYLFANSFGFNQSIQVYRGTLSGFIQTGFTGGKDYRYVHFTLHQKPVTIAIYQDFGQPDSIIKKSIHQILFTENKFWNDFGFRHYFVSIIAPYKVADRDGSSVSGTSGQDAFFATASRRARLQTLHTLIAHETFHNWLPHKLGTMPEPKATWFTEGFTSYYTELILLQSGLLSFQEMISSWNEKLVAYYNSPVIHAPLDSMRKYFFNDYNYQRLPYNKGFLLALHWDQELKMKSNGAVTLQTVLRQLMADAKKKKHHLSTEFLCSRFSTFLGRDVLPEVNELWVTGRVYPFNYQLNIPFARTDSFALGKFDIGFDAPETYRTRIISGVNEGSAAYDAGLRNGMELVDDFYRQNDPAAKATIIVMDKGVRKNIIYLPAGKGETTVPRFLLNRPITEQDKAIIKSCFKVI